MREDDPITLAVAAEDLRRPHPGFVYFIECDGAVKIGYSRDWVRRVASLRGTNPRSIEVLMVIKAPRTVEGDIHCRLQSDRIRGEWFRPTDALVSVLEDYEHMAIP